MYLSGAIIIVAALAWDAFRRYLVSRQPPPVPPEALTSLQTVTSEAVGLLNEYGQRLQKVEKWVNGEEARRSIGRARAR